MAAKIKLKLNVAKIPKERIFVGTKGKYLDIVCVENRDGQDQYGNDGFVKIDISKEAATNGEKGEIIGNWKYLGQKPPTAAAQNSTQSAPSPEVADDDIPWS